MGNLSKYGQNLNNRANITKIKVMENCGNMVNSDKTPRFNLKVVVRETGLKPDTLRAWERRYGLPEPNRTSGGHRLYSQYDIEMLKWLVARQDEGLSISRAVDLWHQLETDGTNPLDSFAAPEVTYTPALMAGGAVADFQDKWITACKKFDELQAQQTLAQAFALFSIETVCFELLQKGLATIGQSWYAGEVTVQQEHFASALAMRQLEALLAATPPPTRNGRLIVACPPQELHTFSALLITLLLRRRGWDVVYLGANVPKERFESVITAVHPRLLILSAQTLHTASTTLEIANEMHTFNIPVAFGGAVFNHIPEIIQRIPGYFLGANLETIPQVVERILEDGRSLPPAHPPHIVYQQALANFWEQKSAVETNILRQVADPGLAAYLEIANREMSTNIIAALKLGNMEFLYNNIQWLRGLLTNYHDHMNPQLVKQYLTIYHHAAQHVLDERGQPIVQWLEKAISY